MPSNKRLRQATLLTVTLAIPLGLCASLALDVLHDRPIANQNNHASQKLPQPGSLHISPQPSDSSKNQASGPEQASTNTPQQRQSAGSTQSSKQEQSRQSKVTQSPKNQLRGRSLQVQGQRHKSQAGLRGSVKPQEKRQALQRLIQQKLKEAAEKPSQSPEQDSDFGALIIQVKGRDNQQALPRQAITLKLSGSLPSGAEQALNTALLPRSGLSDEQGLLTIPNLPRALRYQLTVAGQDYAPILLTGIKLQADKDTVLTVLLDKGQSITGRVTDEQDQALAGVQVHGLYHIERAGAIRSQSLSQGDGRFSLTVTKDSVNDLLFTKQGYESVQLRSIAAGRSEVQVQLKKRSNARLVKGRALDAANGTPLAQIVVNGQNLSAVNGFFEILLEAQNQSTLTVTLESPGYLPQSHSRPLTDSDTLKLGALSFEAGRDFYGRLLSQGPLRHALAGLIVSLPSLNRQTVTDPLGHFSFTALPRQSLTLHIDGGARHQSQDVVIAANTTEQPAAGDSADLRRDIVLEAGQYSLAVYVENTEGQALEGAVVSFAASQQLTDSHGLALLTGMTQSQGELEVLHDDYARFSQAEVQASDSDNPGLITVVLQAGTVLSGRVTRRGESLGAQVQVSLWEPRSLANPHFPGGHTQTSTDMAGRYRFDQLPEGEYFIHVPAFQHVAQKLTVRKNQSTRWDISVPGTVNLMGRISQSNGQPHSNVTIYLLNGEQHNWSGLFSQTNSQGEYEFMNIRPGNWVLSLLKSPVDQSAQFVKRVMVEDTAVVVRNVTLPAFSNFIEGRVVDPNGQPVASLHVGCERLDAEHREILAGWGVTDSQGRIRFPRLNAGAFRVRTSWSDRPQAFSPVIHLGAEGSSQFQLVLENSRAARVSGQVISADGGPIHGSFLFVLDDQGRQAGNFFGTNAWGHSASYQIKGLPHNKTYRIIATARDHLKKEVTVNVQQSDLTNIVITLDRKPS